MYNRGYSKGFNYSFLHEDDYKWAIMTHDYQGNGIVHLCNDKWIMYSYGSCGGCDRYLDRYSYEQDSLRQEFLDNEAILSINDILKDLKSRSDWDLEADSALELIMDYVNTNNLYIYIKY